MAYGIRETKAVIKTIGGIVIFMVCLAVCWAAVMYERGKTPRTVDSPVEAVPPFCTVQDMISMQEVINECHERLRNCQQAAN